MRSTYNEREVRTRGRAFTGSARVGERRRVPLHYSYSLDRGTSHRPAAGGGSSVLGLGATWWRVPRGEISVVVSKRAQTRDLSLPLHPPRRTFSPPCAYLLLSCSVAPLPAFAGTPGRMVGQNTKVVYRGGSSSSSSR